MKSSKKRLNLTFFVRKNTVQGKKGAPGGRGCILPWQVVRLTAGLLLILIDESSMITLSAV
jgi:hypothetical protein